MVEIIHHTKLDPCPNCSDKLVKIHPTLGEFFLAVHKDHPDCHIAWGYRDEASQKEAVLTGHSKLEWPNSKHNTLPSQAIDLFQINDEELAIFNPVFYAKIADQYPKLIWGGRWKFRDLDHYELPATGA